MISITHTFFSTRVSSSGSNIKFVNAQQAKVAYNYKISLKISLWLQKHREVTHHEFCFMICNLFYFILRICWSVY